MACTFANLIKAPRVEEDESIERVLEAIASCLEIKNRQIIVVAANQLKQEGFETFRHLCRIEPPELLEEVKLPLLIETELISIIRLHGAENDFEVRQEASGEEYQPTRTLKKRPSLRGSLGRSLRTSGSSVSSVSSVSSISSISSAASSGAEDRASSSMSEDENFMAYPFTPEQRDLILETWGEMVRSDQDSKAFTKAIYDRLIARESSAQRLFKGYTMKRLKSSFYGMIHVLVLAVTKPAQVKFLARGIGVRHQLYGVKKEHFTAMGRSLFQAFKDSQGAKFTKKHREAWVCVFTWITDMMQDAMRRCTSGRQGRILLAMQEKAKFRTYHATLTNFRLFLRKRKNDPPKYSFQLSDILDVSEATKDLGTPLKFKELCFVLELKGDKRVYFSCSSQVELNDWLNELDWRIVATSRCAASIFSGEQQNPKKQQQKSFLRWTKRNQILGSTTE